MPPAKSQPGPLATQHSPQTQANSQAARQHTSPPSRAAAPRCRAPPTLKAPPSPVCDTDPATLSPTRSLVAHAMPCRAAALALAALLLLRAHAQSRFSVEPVDAGLGPSPRADHLTVVLQSGTGFLVVVHGGRDAAGAKSDTWAYIVAENRWQLLAAPARAKSDPPPPMWGAVGGYRFVDGLNVPFLYVTLGTTADGVVTNRMWVMEFDNFTWREVALDGHLPAPRFGAVGSLERFAKPNGQALPALIISHGRGEDGPLSDTYKCSFDHADPYRATWRKLRGPVGQYGARAPHPAWMQASTFTASRDLVVFGGCYASERHGGICPSRLTWLLKYEAEKTIGNGTSSADGAGDAAALSFVPETDAVSWKSMPGDPPPRVGAAMAQGPNSFEGVYPNREAIAVLYSGAQHSEDLPTDHVISAPAFDGGVVHLLSTSARTWLTEKVSYAGPPDRREEVLLRRRGSTLSIVRNATIGQSEPDVPTEFFLLFGGQFEDGNFTNALIQLSFNASFISELVDGGGRYATRPFVHGMLMFLSWGVLMVIGAFSARYKKHSNGRSRHFKTHVVIQTTALVLAWAGVGLAIYGRRHTAASFLHAHLGIALITLASVQPVIAVIGVLTQIRGSPLPGSSAADGMLVNLRLVPKLCRYYHQIMGLVLLVLGSVNITLGLFMIVAPTLIWVHWIVYSCLLGICALLLEIIGGRKAAEVLQTRASSMSKVVSGRISVGSSYFGRMIRSLRGDSTAQVLQGRSFRGAGDDDIPPATSAEDLIVPAEDQISPTKSAEEMEVPPERRESIPRSLTPVPLPATGDAVWLEEALGSAPNSTTRGFRERLDSGMSSVYTYIDPDTY